MFIKYKCLTRLNSAFAARIINAAVSRRDGYSVKDQSDRIIMQIVSRSNYIVLLLNKYSPCEYLLENYSYLFEPPKAT